MAAADGAAEAPGPTSVTACAEESEASAVWAGEATVDGSVYAQSGEVD